MLLYICSRLSHNMAPVQLVLKRIDNKESSAFLLADATITNGDEGSSGIHKETQLYVYVQYSTDVQYNTNSCDFYLCIVCSRTHQLQSTLYYMIPYAQYILQKALRRRCWASRYAPREHFCELSPCCKWRPSPSFVYPPNQTRPKETVCGVKTDKLVCVLLKV